MFNLNYIDLKGLPHSHVSEPRSNVKLTIQNRLGVRILSSRSTEVPFLHHRLAMCLRLASEHCCRFIPCGDPDPGRHRTQRRKLRRPAMACDPHDHRRSSCRHSIQHLLRQKAPTDRGCDPDYPRLRLLRSADPTMGPRTTKVCGSCVHRIYEQQRLAFARSRLSRWDHWAYVLVDRTRLGSAHGRRDQRRIPRTAAGYDVDSCSERGYWLHHGHYVRVLHRRFGDGHHPSLPICIHRHLLHSNWQQSWLHGHGMSNHSHVPVQHHQQRRHSLSPDVRIRARSRHAVQHLPLSVRIETKSRSQRSLLTMNTSVRPGWDIPLNAVCVSFVITCLLSLINLGSSVAFNAIVSLTVGAILSSYIISISCVALRKIRGDSLPHARWSLGRAGLACNIIAVLFLILVYVFAFFPLATPVELTTMNWSSLIYGAVVIFSVCYYFVFGRHAYEGPVVLVNKDY
jgi:hypothetical protein